MLKVSKSHPTVSTHQPVIKWHTWQEYGCVRLLWRSDQREGRAAESLAMSSDLQARYCECTPGLCLLNSLLLEWLGWLQSQEMKQQGATHKLVDTVLCTPPSALVATCQRILYQANCLGRCLCFQLRRLATTNPWTGKGVTDWQSCARWITRY